MFAMDHDKVGLGQDLNMAQHLAGAHALPEVIELTPARDAVHVGLDPDVWKGQKLVIGTFPGLFYQSEDLEPPRGPIEEGRTPGMQNRPFSGQSLSWWYPQGTMYIRTDDQRWH